jgi:hypothetical protein
VAAPRESPLSSDRLHEAGRRAAEESAAQARREVEAALGAVEEEFRSAAQWIEQRGVEFARLAQDNRGLQVALEAAQAALAEREPLEREAERLRAEHARLQALVGGLQQTAQALREELADERAKTERWAERVRSLEQRPAAAPAAPAASGSKGRRPEPAPEDVLAQQFLEWCWRSGGVLGRIERFAEALHQALPGAAVARVYRDADSPARPVELRAGGGASPVEYWAVSADGRHWLLPQPLSAGQFRELPPCFEGAAAPRELRDVVPAALRPSGAGFTLDVPGRVG